MPPVRADRSSRTCESRIATGCFGGEPAKDLETLSRQNWRRIEPTVEVETVSAMREVSMLKARMVRWADWAEGGMKVWRV